MSGSLPVGRSARVTVIYQDGIEVTVWDARNVRDFGTEAREEYEREVPFYQSARNDARPSPMVWAWSGVPECDTDGVTVRMQHIEAKDTNVIPVDVDDLRTQRELADELGATPSAVAMWHHRRESNGFPAPVIQRGPRVKLWSLRAVRGWIAS